MIIMRSRGRQGAAALALSALALTLTPPPVHAAGFALYEQALFRSHRTG